MQTADQLATSASIPIRGAEGLHPDDLHRLLREGSRCVRFHYCLSLIVVTFRCTSRAYLTDTWQTRYLLGLPYSLLTLALGIWGVPWGLVLSAKAVWVNLSGGEDISAQVLAQLEQNGLLPPAEPTGPTR